MKINILSLTSHVVLLSALLVGCSELKNSNPSSTSVATTFTCYSCHGDSTSAAPPKDLAGNTARTARGVGAHRIHLFGGAVGHAVACNECHKVPKTIYDAGHMDQSSGAEINFNIDTTSVFYISSATYNAQTGSCANVYCHGNFKNGNTANAVQWTDISGNATACGTCHGDISRTDPQERARPKTLAEGGTHPSLNDNKDENGNPLKCYRCHGNVVDANLKIIDPSKHINGKYN